MGFFGKLFGKESVSEEELFQRERFVYECNFHSSRYFQLPGIGDLSFNDNDGKTIKMWEAFSDTYQEWTEIKSAWDRQSLLYGLFDKILELDEDWKIAERLLIDRYPNKSLKYVEKSLDNINANTQEIKTKSFITASRVFLALGNYDEALKMGEKALECDNSDSGAKVTVADSLHCLNQHHKAHAIYNQLLDEKFDKEKKIDTFYIQSLFGSWGVLNSPIYAAAFLSEYEPTGELWEWAAAEFYYSPQFRMEHAYKLLSASEATKAFAKMLVVSQEMPWYQEAVVNSLSMIGKFNETGLGKIVPQGEEERLKSLMDKNNWKIGDLPFSREVST